MAKKEKRGENRTHDENQLGQYVNGFQNPPQKRRVKKPLGPLQRLEEFVFLLKRQLIFWLKFDRKRSRNQIKIEEHSDIFFVVFT